MRIVCEACEIAFMVIEHFLLLFLYIYNYIFFSPPKHISTLFSSAGVVSGTLHPVV